MRDYSSYDRPSMQSFSKKKTFEMQMKTEGRDVSINGTIPEKVIIRNNLNVMSDTKEERTLLIGIDSAFKKGDFIYDKDDIYIGINKVDTFEFYKKSKLWLCEQTLNFKGLPKPIPCYTTDSSYGDKGVVDTTLLTVFEKKLLCYTQWNEDTKKIKQDMRFIFDHDKYSIFQVVNISRVTTGNILKIVMNKVEYIESKDDLVNNIAYNDFLDSETPTPPPIIPSTYNIKPSSGDMSINKYGSKTFTIVDGSGVPSSDTWNIELNYNGVPTNHIDIVSKTNNAIRIKNNLGLGNNIKLKFTKGSDILECEVRLIK